MTLQSAIALESSEQPVEVIDPHEEAEGAAAAIIQEVLREPEYLHWTNIGT